MGRSIRWLGVLTAALLMAVIPAATGVADQAEPRPQRKIPKSALLDKQKVSLDVTDLPLRKVIEQLMTKVDFPYVIDAKVPDRKITVKLTDVPFHDAVKAVLGSDTVFPRIQCGVALETCYFLLNPNPPDADRGILGARKRVSLSLKDTPLEVALTMVFMGSGLQYSINPQVLRTPVTADLDNITIEAALGVITKAASKKAGLVRYGLVGNVYMIE